MDNIAHMTAQVEAIEALEQQIRTAAKTKHPQKMLPRARIAALIDTGTKFYELSTLAGYSLYDSPLPAGGIITGVGLIHGKACMIIANDYTVKGGTYFPITIKKHLRAQAIALAHALPCLYLVDSGGAYLPLQSEVFADKEHFGRIFYNQANLSKRGIPQIAVVMGSCTAGGAYVPAMADESVMVKQQATIFLAGPPLVKAATGEIVTAEALGGAEVHCQESGVADHYAADDQDALQIARRIIQNIPYRTTILPDPTQVTVDKKALYAQINADPRHVHDAHAIIEQLVDKDSIVEFKAKYGTTLVCVMAKVNGYTVGIIANNGVLFSESAQKGCHFIQLCNQRGIPLLFLQNITGFMVGKSAESGGIAKHGATLVNAVATASVDKITVLIGGSYGAGNYAMCGRAYEPNFLWAWPNSKTSVMGGEQAAQVLTQIKTDKMPYAERWSDDEEQAFKEKIAQQYQQENAVTYTSARLFDDGVIDPKDTREYIAFALALLQKARNNTPGYGIFRM